MKTQGRGQLTTRIKEKSVELLGYEITQKELRLMPYVADAMLNSQRLDPLKIDQDERDILRKWKEAGYIEGGAGGLAMTKEFWTAIHELLFLGYVDLTA